MCKGSSPHKDRFCREKKALIFIKQKKPTGWGGFHAVRLDLRGFAGFLGGFRDLAGQFGKLLLTEHESEGGNDGECRDGDDVLDLHDMLHC